MQRCPLQSCCRAGDDLGGCGRKVTPCPSPVTVDPTRDVVLRCEPCDLTRAVPAGSILAGARLDRCPCPTSECQAVVVATPRTKPAAKVSDAPPAP